jgi:outer membrane receptor for ferrienterochelin and colicin
VARIRMTRSLLTNSRIHSASPGWRVAFGVKAFTPVYGLRREPSTGWTAPDLSRTAPNLSQNSGGGRAKSSRLSRSPR